jgi:alkylhydroperoxidase family enzyme
MDFAQKVIHHANQVTEEDMDELRRYGLSDEEIFNVVVVITARSFFSKTLDALNVKPDEIYLKLEPELIQALTIGRPFP